MAALAVALLVTPPAGARAGAGVEHYLPVLYQASEVVAPCPLDLHKTPGIRLTVITPQPAQIVQPSFPVFIEIETGSEVVLARACVGSRSVDLVEGNERWTGTMRLHDARPGRKELTIVVHDVRGGARWTTRPVTLARPPVIEDP